jgi:hypothetical protein
MVAVATVLPVVYGFKMRAGLPTGGWFWRDTAGRSAEAGSFKT